MSAPGRAEDRGALALVLHSHMPYVEGFGTWPFGEEWLFEAVATVYLPLIEVLRGRPVTVGLTPVLCDQLEALEGEAGDRLLAFLREIRAPIHAEDSTGMDARASPSSPPSCAVRQATTSALSGRSLRTAGATWSARSVSSRSRATELWTSSATHAVLPLLATTPGLRLQVGTGIASHERRFGGFGGGFWLPECAYEPGLERDLAEHGVRAFCVDQTDAYGLGAPEHLEPVATEAGPVAVPLDWQTVVAGLGRPARLPLHPGYRDYHGRTLARPEAVEQRRRAVRPRGARSSWRAQHARDFVGASVARLDGYAARARPAGPRLLRARHRAARALVERGAGWLRAVLAEAEPPASSSSRSPPGSSASSPSRARAGALDLGPPEGPLDLGPARAWPRSRSRPGARSCPRSRAAAATAHAHHGSNATSRPRAGRARAVRAPVERLGLPAHARARRRLSARTRSRPRGGAATTRSGL